MTILHSITAYTPNPDCGSCGGDGLVCEDHPDMPWFDGDGCCGGAGMPCSCIQWVCGAVGQHPEVCPALARIERGEIDPVMLEQHRARLTP